MPVILKNGLGAFQSVMVVLLTRVKWQFALVYLGDIIIFLRSSIEHILNVRKVLTVLTDVDVTHSKKKLDFFTNSVDYLGHVIPRTDLKLSTLKIDAVRGLQESTKLTDISSFPGI